MAELFDAFYLDPEESNGKTRGLINVLGDAAADYCFDEAWLIWLNDEFSIIEFAPEDVQIAKEYEALSEMLKNPKNSAENVEDYFIRIACAALEIREKASNDKRCEYSTAEGDVQESMYSALFSHADVFEGFSAALDSKDRLTNYVYTFKRAIEVMSQKDAQPNSELSGLAGGFGKSAYFSVGYTEKFHDALVHVSDDQKAPLLTELNAFARNASRLGNYACMPKWVRRVGGLNQLKACYMGCTISAYGNYKGVEHEFLVNDQFALFLEWLENNKQPQDEEMLEDWRAAMRIDAVLHDYLLAAKFYKRAFFGESAKERPATFVKYLKCVNAAIEERSGLIIDELRTSNQS